MFNKSNQNTELTSSVFWSNLGQMFNKSNQNTELASSVFWSDLVKSNQSWLNCKQI